MKHSVYSLVSGLCAALAATSAIGWAAPGTGTGAPGKSDLLVVGQSARIMAHAMPRNLAMLQVKSLSVPDKMKLFEKAGFPALNGIVTKAKFTPSQPLIAKQGLININSSVYWASGSPTDGSYTGYVQMHGVQGSVDLGFIPFLANQPVLVVFNVRTQLGETAFSLIAGGQTQTLILQSGNHNVACLLTPTTTDIQWVTLRSTAGADWAFDSVDVTVQK
jgi:hypothetical protein